MDQPPPNRKKAALCCAQWRGNQTGEWAAASIATRMQTNPMDNNDAIRVGLKLEDDSWHGAGSEGVWVKLIEPLADKAIVEVNNIPFFSTAVSLGDTIVIAFRNNEVVFESVVERGGHSTYRIFFQNPNGDETKALLRFNELGCYWESTSFRGGKLFALDIPPHVNVYDIYEMLESGEKDGLWLFEEGYVGHSPKGAPVRPVM
jgi:hypothetical protein